MYTVYKHTTPNNKVYIGMTGNKPVKRWDNGRGYITQRLFYRAIQKYGWGNIKHEILFAGLTKEQAAQKEIELIALYDSTNPAKGYNCSTGGENGCAGVAKNKEWRRKLSEANKGKRPSKETIAKLKKVRQGKKPALGMKHSEETKLKMSMSHSIYVECLETNEIYKSAIVAGEIIGIDCSSIRKVCREERKTAGGYHWRYVEGVN